MPYLTVWVPDSALYELNQQASFSSRYGNRYGSFNFFQPAAMLIGDETISDDAAKAVQGKVNALYPEGSSKVNQKGLADLLKSAKNNPAEQRAIRSLHRQQLGNLNKARKTQQAINVAGVDNWFKRQALKGTYAAQNLGTTMARNPGKTGLAAAAALGAGAYGLSRRGKKRRQMEE
jgi:hypothetical protein